MKLNRAFLRNYVPGYESIEVSIALTTTVLCAQFNKMTRSLRKFQLYLSRAIHRQRLGHAILLTGADRQDKTALTHFFAMALFCRNTLVVDEIKTPCRTCHDCLQISQQRHSNIDWVASKQSEEIRIDQIRELREHLRLSSFNDRPRLIIIENADGLTMQAANALLKSIEEPNQNQYFLLMASSESALPKTLLSRCQRLRCKSDSDDLEIHSGSDEEVLAQFAASLLDRIRSGDLNTRVSVIEAITKHPCDKTQLLLKIQKILLTELLKHSEPSNKAQRDSLRKPLEATEQSLAFLDQHVNLQLTLENWLLKAWPTLKK